MSLSDSARQNKDSGDWDNCLFVQYFQPECACLHVQNLAKHNIYICNKYTYESRKTNKRTKIQTNLIIIHNQWCELSVCACLTVQSTPVRSSLLGPLDAGGREGCGGPRCWRPEREIAFLKTTQSRSLIDNQSLRRLKSEDKNRHCHPHVWHSALATERLNHTEN